MTCCARLDNFLFVYFDCSHCSVVFPIHVTTGVPYCTDHIHIVLSALITQ